MYIYTINSKLNLSIQIYVVIIYFDNSLEFYFLISKNELFI